MVALASLLDDGSFTSAHRAPAPARCAHGILEGRPCWSCLMQRADAAAERDLTVRSMLRETSGSRWRTLDLQGTSRKPLFGDLLAAVQRAERGS